VSKTRETIQYDMRPSKAISQEPPEIWLKRIGYALRCLNDRSKINQSPLARLAYVERLAKDKYQGRILPRGLALSQLLLACIDHVVSDVGNEPGLSKACQYLQLLAAGASCREISVKMGLSREHISRVYRKKAVELVTESFIPIVKNGR